MIRRFTLVRSGYRGSGLKKFVGRAVVVVATAGLAVGTVVGAGSANAQWGLYGAIAFSASDWSYGSSVDAYSREDAIDEAMAWCGLGGVTDCRVLVDWVDGCGALVSTKGAVGTGAGSNSSIALFAAHTSLAQYRPQAMLANVGSADLSGAQVVEVICTANAS